MKHLIACLLLIFSINSNAGLLDDIADAINFAGKGPADFVRACQVTIGADETICKGINNKYAYKCFLELQKRDSLYRLTVKSCTFVKNKASFKAIHELLDYDPILSEDEFSNAQMSRYSLIRNFNEENETQCFRGLTASNSVTISKMMKCTNDSFLQDSRQLIQL